MVTKAQTKSILSEVLYRFPVSVVFAVALDLLLAISHGYLFRADKSSLLILNALFLNLFVLFFFAVLLMATFLPRVGDWLRKIPWSVCLLVAILPIGLTTLYRFHDPLSLFWHACVLAFFFFLSFLEAKGLSRAHRWIMSLAICGVVIGAVLFLVNPPLPGKSMLSKKTNMARIPSTKERPNLLLIVLDTMRYDHLETYGYPRPTSPWIKSFGQKATVFDYAFTSSSYTLPSHATLFTSLYSRSHGADTIEGEGGASLESLGRLDDEVPVAPLAPEALTLAEIAKEARLETAAICGNTAYLYRYFGFDQGFDTYVDERPVHYGWRPAGLSLGGRLMALIGKVSFFDGLLESNERFYLFASEVNSLALQWLEPRIDRRFFLFLNYNDPHHPYLPIGKYKEIFPDTSGSLIDAYDAETRYMDDHLAALFHRLESWNILDRTLVVIVGDHGESFWEHGKIGHAVTVYEPEVRIPLLLKYPGQEIGRRVNRFVHLVDVMPTILDYMGFERPQDLQGDSLLGNGRPFPIIAYLGKYYRDYEERAIYDDPWKLIFRTNGEIELYNIRENPEETENLASQKPELVSKIVKDLTQYLEEVQPRFPGTSHKKMDKETLERLRALGYIK
jgi:arylsulfatase A-like enzyme